MVLPTSSFGLEQFIEMTKALKWMEDKYKKPQYHQQNRHESSTGGNIPDKENHQPTEPIQMTSQPSQITRNTQIGNISVEQMATSQGSNPDHLIEALEEVFTTPQSTEEQAALKQESQ